MAVVSDPLKARLGPCIIKLGSTEKGGLLGDVVINLKRNVAHVAFHQFGMSTKLREVYVGFEGSLEITFGEMDVTTWADILEETVVGTTTLKTSIGMKIGEFVTQTLVDIERAENGESVVATLGQEEERFQFNKVGLVPDVSITFGEEQQGIKVIGSIYPDPADSFNVALIGDPAAV